MGVAAVHAEDESPAGGYDPDRYYEQVVRGLRGRPHDLPEDLVHRYALPDGLTEVFLQAHLEHLLDDWRARLEETREGAVYGSLLAAHAELEADPDVDLRSPAWWARYRRPCSRNVEQPRLEPGPKADRAEPLPGDRRGSSEVVPAPRPAPATPVDGPRDLTVRRCTVGAELAWVWPSWGVEAVVEWPTNAPDGMQRQLTRLTRHEFEQLGCWRMPVRDEETSFAVTVRGIGRTAPPLTATLRARPPEVHYTISRLWWRLGSHDYRVVVSTQWPPPPYCEIVIGWSGSRFLPDPDDLQELGSLPVSSGVIARTVSLPRRSGARWVRCFLREADDVVLHEPDRDRLKVRPWPR
jgi:hypothetical protein